MNFLFFDTETTGLPLRSQPVTAPGQPHITQLGLILEINGTDALVVDSLIQPKGWTISPEASAITGITLDMCERDGIAIEDALDLYMLAVEYADFIVCHNYDFDGPQMEMEFARVNKTLPPSTVHAGKPSLCTMKATTPILKLPKKGTSKGWKWPKLSEAYRYYFNKELENAHSAIVDISATREIFNLLVDDGVFDQELAAYAAQRKAA